LLRLRSETIRVMDDLAEDEKTSRVVMVQRALDEWIALKTEPA
jgi:predicted transcriptional regulator